jgi:dihydrofolate reductase
MERMDGIVLGRNTFELVLSFDPWPYRKPVFVLSRTLKEIPAELQGKAELVSGPLKEVLDTLRSRGMTNLYIDGGKTIQGFLQQDLIDTLIITRIPIILGSGIPLFAEMDREIRFELIHTEMLNKDLVKSTYARKA